MASLYQHRGRGHIEDCLHFDAGYHFHQLCIYLIGKPDMISVLLDFSLTVKVATLIFISGRGSAISSAKEGKSGLFIIW